LPTPRLVTISAWSYSRLGTYNACPRKAKYLYIDKLSEPDSTAGLRGTRAHAIAAMIATGKLPAPDRDNKQFYAELAPILKAKEFPAELAAFEIEFRALRKRKNIQVEAQWCFDRNREPVSWFGSDAWLRLKVDLHYLTQKKRGVTEVDIVDHKTGKWSSDHALQRSLYALGAFLQYPDAQVVRAAHWYLDIGKENKDMWERSELESLWKEWLRRTEALLHDTTYAPSPGQHCNWCAFAKSKGGPCEY
jgi:CRISPR/Cas system-associated exonuclease Cas4 (RecB family)